MPSTATFNELAEARKLPAWTSWQNGRPAGYYSWPIPPEAAAFFAENGFLVIENGVTAEELKALQEESANICRGELGVVNGLQERPDDESPEDTLRRYLCIHFPHKISKLMLSALSQPAIVDVVTSVIGPNVKCMQSMLFIKPAGKPGQAWHQDEIYIPTRDRSLTGGWIALDDATVENGCLWVIPKSQREGILYFQEWHGDSRFDCASEAQRFPWSNKNAVPVEVKAGSIVFFNGYLLHRSLPNYANRGFRRALVNHYMSAESLLPWTGFQPEVPVASADYRDIVMIAGTDPYAFKGIENKAGAHVRPSGEGGCGSNKYNLVKESDPLE